ncbi:MAG: cytochrome c biogenesis protein CcsA [Methylophilaceae bacterium]|nr:cytochrome c biogenesis protein CcsA [Methylophilaceae bacterium]
MHSTIISLIVVFIYLAVAFDFWRTVKPAAEHNLKLHSSIIALGLLLHGSLLYDSVISHGLNLGFYNALSLIFWLTLLIYWLANIKHHLQSLQAFVLPPAALFALLPTFFVENHYLSASVSTLFVVHIVIAIFAYSLFTFGALHALLMLIAERNLHQKTSLIKLPSFPPLMVMERLLFKVIGVGFILLTFTLISGMLFSEEIFGKPMQFSHKIIFSIASWLIYGGLLLGRYTYGWRGRKAIRWVLVGFVLLLLAYVGSKFVLEILLHR